MTLFQGFSFVRSWFVLKSGFLFWYKQPVRLSPSTAPRRFCFGRLLSLILLPLESQFDCVQGARQAGKIPLYKCKFDEYENKERSTFPLHIIRFLAFLCLVYWYLRFSAN
jgi:hypothetical protein